MQMRYGDWFLKKICNDLHRFRDGEIIFSIHADYRPKATSKNLPYYVLARTKKEAKEKFYERLSWLKIYDCTPLDSESDKKRCVDIIINQEHYIFLS